MAGILSALVLSAVASGGETSCPGRAAEAARKAYEGLELAKVLSLTADVDACEDGTGRELAEALKWRAQALDAQKDSEGATKTFAQIETLAPGFELDPMLSPRLHELHKAGRARAVQQAAVFARRLAPVTDRSGTKLRVQVFNPTGRDVSVAVQLDSGEKLPALETGEPYVWEVKAPTARGQFRVLVSFQQAVLFTSRAFALPDVTEAPVAPVLTPGAKLAGPEVTLNENAPGTRPVVIAGVVAAIVVVVGIVAGVVYVATRPPRQTTTGALGQVEIPLRSDSE